jgi:SAM-dependent methyltransferase
VSLRAAWDDAAAEWIAWARAPGHDSYWQFHREALLALLPAPGRLTLDVGCGEGRVARDLTAIGHHVVGVDGSPAMARAAAAHPDPHGDVVVGDAAALPVRDGCADLVVAFMSLQDVDDLDAAIREAARVLEPGGRLFVAVVHPVNSAGYFDRRDGRNRWPFVIRDSWFAKRRYVERIERDGLGMTFVSDHRPLQDYAEALARAGFLIERLREPTDPDPDDAWHEFPMFLHLLAVKQ